MTDNPNTETNPLLTEPVESVASMMVVAEPAIPVAATVAVDETPPPDMTVVAQNPQEMMIAQARLVAWAERKVADTRAALADLKDNLTQANCNVSCRRWGELR